MGRGSYFTSDFIIAICVPYVSHFSHRYYGLRVKRKNLFLRTMSGFQSLAVCDVNTLQMSGKAQQAYAALPSDEAKEYD